jgi:LDH2 family malate/lactate/ureidoglycolate dehydrogenase
MTDAQTANAGTTQVPFYVDAEAAEAFGRRLLIAHNLPEEDAATVARCLVKADLRGVDTHGLQTLPHYLDRVRRGLINPRPNLKVERVTPMAGRLDGQDAFGFVVATKAMDEAIDMAGEFGVGIVSARRSTHFGAACNYALQAMDAGYIGIVFTNASKAMPPWGGRVGLLGTSPIAVAAPAGKEMPFDLDMSPAVAARGKIRRICWPRGAASRFRSATRSTPRGGKPPTRTPRSMAVRCSRSAARKALRSRC